MCGGGELHRSEGCRGAYYARRVVLCKANVLVIVRVPLAGLERSAQRAELRVSASLAVEHDTAKRSDDAGKSDPDTDSNCDSNSGFHSDTRGNPDTCRYPDARANRDANSRPQGDPYADSRCGRGKPGGDFLDAVFRTRRNPLGTRIGGYADSNQPPSSVTQNH